MTTMLNLEKGQKIDLTKNNPGLKKIKVGLSWDVKDGTQCDADASCICLGENNKMIDENSLVYYNNSKDANHSLNKYIIHSGDNLTGEGEGDDETIIVDLAQVPENFKSLLFTVTMYAHGKKVNFGQVENLTCRLYDAENNEVISSFDLSEDFSTFTALEMVKLYKKDNEWKAEAIGEGIGKSDNGLQDVLSKYKG